ncbi:MAG: 50S ribosomal protein L10 [Spirochaetes bacterium]|nr:50S ribosomal protein L10 [Spirochaetota bacterium]
MVQQYKINAVEELVKNLKESKHLIFTEYKGLNVAKMTELRRKLFEVDSEFKVIKNRLAKQAYKKLELDFQDDWFVGPVALVVCKNDDFVRTVSIVHSYAKDNEAFKIKLGYLGKKIYGIDELKEISLLPSRDQLLARLVNALKSPVNRFVFGLKWILKKPVLVLKAIENKKK